MTWKSILTFFVFFLAIPLLFGQTPEGIPSAPTGPTTPTSTPAINATDLQGAGLNTQSMSGSWGEQARQNQGDFNQGLPQNVPSSEIPTEDSEGAARSFAQELFPQEYSASQGQLNNIPESASSPSPPSFPSSPSTSPPSTPSSPSSPSL